MLQLPLNVDEKLNPSGFNKASKSSSLLQVGDELMQLQ
jgi:hypothetical protein